MKISAKRVVTSADRADRAALKAAIAVARKHRERARELAELERQGSARRSGYSFGYIVPCLIEIDTCAAFEIGHFCAF